MSRNGPPLTEVGPPARAASSRSSSACIGEKSRSRRKRGGGGQAALDRILARGVGAVGDGEEGRERGEPDELGLGELDAVLGGHLADASPRPATAAWSRSRGGSSRPGPGRAPRSRTRWPGPAGRPPPDSRTRRAIRLASSTSRRVEVDVVGDQERSGADRDGAGRRVHPRRPEVRARDRAGAISVLSPSYWPRRTSASLTRSGRAGRLGVQEDRQLEPVGDPLPEGAGQLDAVVHRRRRRAARTG